MTNEQLMNELTFIAQRIARVDSLESRMSDSKDFYSVSVWEIKDMLLEAYELGLNHKEK